MALFRYKILQADDTHKTSQITAKSVDEARARVAKQDKVKEWLWIKEVKVAKQIAPIAKIPVSAKPLPKAAAVPKPPPPSPKLADPKPAAAKPSTKLEKLLYLQSNKCFFCGKVLTKAEATTEHLQPKSGGGNNQDGNLVACCSALNRTFGSIPLKEKVRIILDKAGKFTCPAGN